MPASSTTALPALLTLSGEESSHVVEPTARISAAAASMSVCREFFIEISTPERSSSPVLRTKDHGPRTDQGPWTDPEPSTRDEGLRQCSVSLLEDSFP